VACGLGHDGGIVSYARVWRAWGMTARPDVSEERRAQIIEAALACVNLSCPLSTVPREVREAYQAHRRRPGALVSRRGTR
jgi:hypothetical protein